MNRMLEVLKRIEDFIFWVYPCQPKFKPLRLARRYTRGACRPLKHA